MILLIKKHLKSYLKGFIKKITKEEAKRKQYEFNAIIGVLEDYTPRNNKYVKAKNKLLNNVKKKKKKITRRDKKLLKGLKTDFLNLIMMKRGKNKRDTKEKKKKN